MSDLVVGLLAEDFISALGLTTDARQIVLSRKSQQHILKRRQVASTADAALAAHRISDPGQHRVYIDPVGRQVPGQLVGEAYDPRFGRGVWKPDRGGVQIAESASLFLISPEKVRLDEPTIPTSRSIMNTFA